MAKNGHRKERRSVTHLLAMDKRRRKAKGPIKKITAADMQRDHEQLTAQFAELGRLWKIYKVYFDIVGTIDPSKKEDTEFTTNHQTCIDEDSKVDTTVTALKSKSFNTENEDDDMTTFESTLGVFDVLQESVLVMNDTYTKLTSINTYCKAFYESYRTKIYEITDIYGKVFDRMFDFTSDEITVDVDMSKEEDTSYRNSGLVRIPNELKPTKPVEYIVTDSEPEVVSQEEKEELIEALSEAIPNDIKPEITDNSTLEMDFIDPEAFKNVDKSEINNDSYLELTSSHTLDDNNVTEKENYHGEEDSRTEREESKED